MPIPMARDMLLEQHGASTAPYPANTKQAAGIINGVRTEVMSVSFSDKVMVTIVQGGRLAQWVCERAFAEKQSFNEAYRFTFLLTPIIPIRRTKHSQRTLSRTDSYLCHT